MVGPEHSSWTIDFIFHICEQQAPKAKNGNVTKSPDKATVQPLQNILKSGLSCIGTPQK